MKLFKFKKILLKEYINHLQDRLNHTNQVLNETEKTIANTSILIDNHILETQIIEEKKLLESVLNHLPSNPTKQKV